MPQETTQGMAQEPAPSGSHHPPPPASNITSDEESSDEESSESESEPESEPPAAPEVPRIQYLVPQQQQYVPRPTFDELVSVRHIDYLLDEHPSRRLASLINKLEQVRRGHGFLPASQLQSFRIHANPQIRNLANVPDAFSLTRRASGPVPSKSLVLDIQRGVTACLSNDNEHEPATWNMAVNSHILDAAFRPRTQTREDPPRIVDYFPCSNASTHPAFQPWFLPTARADFCVFLHPELESPYMLRDTQQIRDQLPVKSINHTPYHPLRNKPIGMSIEVQRPGTIWEPRNSSMTAWQSAQWHILDAINYLVYRREPHHEPIMPEFIPCIVIQATEWNLLITTREGEKTIFWSQMLIGSTSSVKGTFQLVYSLQLLVQALDTNYWIHLRNLVEAFHNAGTRDQRTQRRPATSQ